MAKLGDFILVVTVTTTLIILSADFSSAGGFHCCHCPVPKKGDSPLCKDGSPCNPHCKDNPDDCNWFNCGCYKPCRGDTGDSATPRNDPVPELNEILKEFDVNEDGEWDMAEIEAMAESGIFGDPSDPLSNPEVILKSHDTNGDGKLSLEEILSPPTDTDD